jgi:HlyD family secretion protein
MPGSVQAAAVLAVVAVGACSREPSDAPPRASGYVEATEVQVAAKVPGRAEEVRVTEGARVTAGDVLVRLATTDTDLALGRAKAERAGAAAQARLLDAGARVEDLRQAEAQVAAGTADVRAAEAELEAALADEQRYQQLVDRNAGATKPRDDARARRQATAARVQALRDRLAAAEATLARLRAGARAEERDAARARLAAADAEITTLNQRRDDATIVAPAAGTVVSRLVEPGELVPAGAPVAVLLDLDHAWVNAYVEEPLVPTLRIGQAAMVLTDAGDRVPGTVAVIAPRAEFTPRNVQTTAERARLVYRVKITVDNRNGMLKPGMPVEVELSR